MKDYIIGLGLALALSGCYYDNEEDLYPGGGNCDTTVTTYSARIRPIIETRCYSCHSAQNAPVGGGNINLQDIGTLQQLATGGTISGVINHASGYLPMPKGMPKLSDCEIAAIERWIRNGAQNN